MKTGGDCTASDLWAQCRAGTAFLLVVHEDDEIIAASVWRTENWATGTKLRCLALYGRDMERWLSDKRKAVKSLMHQCGARSVVTEGRAGWAKLFPEARQLRVLYEAKL